MQPGKLGSRGQELWDAVTENISLDPAGEALLAECCRTFDIVDRLEGALHSKHQEWVRLADDIEYEGDVAMVKIVVNPILGEIRQQRLAFMQMLRHLKMGVVQDQGNNKTESLFERLEKAFSD